MSGKTCTIYLVRHGQTENNQAMRLQGRSDMPLNARGAAQAEALGAWFAGRGIRFDRVYTSPLRRAVSTAERIAGEGARILPDEHLLEMEYGPYEGMDLRDPAPEVLAFFRDFVHNPAPAGMEPLGHVVRRLGAFLEALRREAPSGNVLISTHAIAMKAALEYLTPDADGRYWATQLMNCAVYRCVLADGGYSVPEELNWTEPAEAETL